MTALLIAIVVLAASAGDVVITRGMKQVGEITTLNPKQLLVIALRVLRNKNFLVGLFLMAVSFFAFLAVLSRADLSLVVPATSLSFVITTVGARLVLKERIDRLRWGGTILVTLGVALISLPDVTAIIPALKFLILACILAANAYYVVTMIAAARFFTARPTSDLGDWPPVSILIPLHGAEPSAYETYSRFCLQDYPEYEIVFGVRKPSDTAIPVVERLSRAFPERRIELVVCPDLHGENLKVSNLQNALARTSYEHIVIVDSDIRVASGYLREVVAPLCEDGVGLVTCLYRAGSAPDLAARLEAVGITGEFAGGVLVARMLEGVKFALGSTIATTRAQLSAIGGLEAVTDYLADDFMLGNLVSRTGREVRLSHQVVETMLSPIGLTGAARHQLRWGRSTRISRPLGYLGLILTYGTALSVLYAAIDGGSAASLIILGVTLGIRLASAWLIGVHWLGDRILLRNFWLVPIRDLLSFLIWCASIVGKRVEWRGRLFEVLRDGKIVAVKPRKGAGAVKGEPEPARVE